jgi:hypothetical protein
VFFRYHVVTDFSTRECGGSLLEFLCEGDIIEESPGIVELVVPGRLELAHGGEEVGEFFIADEGEERGVYAWGVGIVGGVVVVGVVVEEAGRFANR